MKQITDRIQVTGHTTGAKWRITHAANVEGRQDFMNQDYALSPAVAATLQATGYVAGSVTLIDVAIDPVEVRNV